VARGLTRTGRGWGDGGHGDDIAMPAIIERHPSRPALLLALVRRALTRAATALVIRDRGGAWLGPPIGARTALARRPGAVYEVALRRQPLILGVRLDTGGHLTAHLLVSFWVDDPVRVVSAGAAETRARLHESIVTSIRSLLADDAGVDAAVNAAANAAAVERAGLMASAGGLCWALHRVRIGPDISDTGGVPLSAAANPDQLFAEQRRRIEFYTDVARAGIPGLVGFWLAQPDVRLGEVLDWFAAWDRTTNALGHDFADEQSAGRTYR
jgi:hypothetical protein